ncbi:MAG: TAXI family TRAP transporter solute-binding subunit [Clostridia bacterium]|nr:TAXI family TRAP transporter solute-binding subunit [Clostridia bacterium]
MKRKNIFSVLLIILLVLSLTVGCGKQDSAQEGDAGNNNAKEKIVINFPTASTTGTIYPLGAAMANMWNNKLDNVQVNAQASNGGVHNLNLLKDKEAQISFAVSSITWEAMHGEGKFEGRKYEDVRVVAGLYYNPNQVVAREAAGINSIADFKGKSFVPGAPGSTPEVETMLHFTEYGLNYPDDIKANFVGFTEAIDLMRNNQTDGAWIMAGLPTAAVTEMTATAGGKLIGIEPEIIAGLQKKYPWYAEFIIPANTYDNQPEDVLTTAVKMLLITDASLPEDVIYDLTKTFWENLDEIRQAHTIVDQIKIEDAVTDLSGIPLHPGAEKYYREVGLIE